MNGYKNLKIHERAHAFGVAVHQLTLKLPRYELYECGSQLRRSSKSISANIVEGYGRRRYAAEYIRFLIFAQASLDESREWLDYIRDLYPHLIDQEFEQIESMALETGRMLGSFIRKVEVRT